MIPEKLLPYWDHSKNGSLKPEQLTPFSSVIVWWQCLTNPTHVWEQSVLQRNRAKSPCKICRGAIGLSKTNNLLLVYPRIAAQWDPYENGELTPDRVSPMSHKFVHWRCLNDHSHKWEQRVYERVRGESTCLICDGIIISPVYNLQVIHPEVAGLWHHTRNNGIEPSDISPSTASVYWWECGFGHEWQRPVNDQIRSMGCSKCNLNTVSEAYNLAVSYPDVAREWHPTRNGAITPDKIGPSSSIRCWWLCSNGHEWEDPVYYRTKSQPGCQYCVGRYPTASYNIATEMPEVAKQWHPSKNHPITPYEVTPTSTVKYWWVCDSCSHEWFTSPYSRRRTGCIRCNYRGISCRRFINSLTDAGFNIIPEYNVIKNPETGHYLRADVYLVDYNLIIEIDGKQHFVQVMDWKSPKVTQQSDAIKMIAAAGRNISTLRLYQPDIYNHEGVYVKRVIELLPMFSKLHQPSLFYVDHPELQELYLRLMASVRLQLA